MLRLPPADQVGPDSLLEGFIDYVDALGLEMYAAQEDAVLELFSGQSVILNTPTGSGKSLVALAMHYMALAQGRRAFYTAPIKALVSEKFFDLCRVLGPENVGMMTGDASVNRDAPIICCTAEILSNLALRDGEDADVDYVVMDEFHYYSDRERGVAWQVPLLTLPHTRFLLMSATLGDTGFFEECLSSLTGHGTTLVRSDERPVPLDFEYRETLLHETIDELLSADKQPIYIVHFTQRRATEQAQNLMSVDFHTKEAKAAIKAELKGFRFDSPFGKVLKRFVHHGVGVHHAGMLPKYRLMVEKLAQQGHLKLICGTDTLGVGVNIPIRTVLFTQLCKYDGLKTGILTARQFKQIAGRAGRRGFDDRGSVVVQAPEHDVENLLARRKAEGDPKKLRKLKPRKPPTKGYSHWDRDRFERLRAAAPEPLVSSFEVSHGMLLHVLSRPMGGCLAMKRLIRTCHEHPKSRRAHGRKAITMLRALIDAEVVSLEPDGIMVNEDLQSDFSLNHALSLYLLEAIGELDPDAETHALDVLSLVESIQENPSFVLRRQLDRLKTDTVNRLKAEGVEYDERMRILDELEYPKPLREFIYGSFNDYAKRHPWVGTENIRPKSIAREMFEGGFSFREYVKEYGLAPGEGVLLRYLSGTYKSLVQNVPEGLKNDEIYDLCDWIRAVLQQVDSSLIEEWEALINPDQDSTEEVRPEVPDDTPELLRDPRRLEILVRNESWRLVTLLARKRYEDAAGFLAAPSSGTRWNAESLADLMAPYWDAYSEVATDADARAPKNLHLTRNESEWEILQGLSDPDGDRLWALALKMDLANSAAEGRPILTLDGVRF